MKKFRALTMAFLFAGMFLWGQTALAAGTPTTTVTSLMKVLKEDKQKAVYNIDLNAPFNKDKSGVRETVNPETGEVSVTNNIFDIQGRNGMDLELNLQYSSRDAKTHSEGTTNTSSAQAFGEYLIAVYDIFDNNGYWVGNGTINYSAGETIINEYPYDGKRWVFNGTLQSVNGTAMYNSGSIANAAIERSRATAAKYIFGEGWSLDMPSLDVDGSMIHVSLPNGQTYKADFTKGTGLADYELTDIVFSEDTSYSNGTDTSKYRLYYANGDAFYFAANGELLAEMDRFRNTIRYYYGDVNGLRVLTKIVDTVGRTVELQYTETGTIVKSGNRTARLTKTPVPGIPGRYYLSSFADTQGRQFKFNYIFDGAAFDQVGKTPVGNTYVNLNEITYPTGAKTKYVWIKGQKNLGSTGYMEYFKVKERNDQDKGRTYNILKYQYAGEPDGYSQYRTDLPETYQYYTVAVDSKGLATKFLYNGKHNLVRKQLSSTRLLSEELTQYHAKYRAPVKITAKTYNSNGSVFEKTSTYDYDSKGNTIAENHPETPTETGDERKAYYTYDSAYNLLTSKKFKQDLNTTVEIKYDLTTDKKNIASETIFGNGKILSQEEYSYDEYGNQTSEKVEKDPGEWVKTTFRYGSEYKGAYLTEVINEGVKDADGFNKSFKNEFTYDFATGNRLTVTDGNGNTTSYEYDSLGRVLKETNPDKSYRTYKYDDLNNILEATNANRNSLVYYYDGLGNLIKVIEPAKNTTLVEMEYDDNEVQISEKDGNKNLKKLAYDELTRITGVTHYDRAGKNLAETRVAYNEAFQDRFATFFKVAVTKKGDKQDRTSSYYFDTYERLAKLGRITGGKEELARYRYDYLGNQTEAVDFANQKSTAQYDALSRLIKSTDAMGSSTRFRYDRLGNMIAQTDALGQTVYFQYDSLGRRIVVKAPFEAGKYAVSKFYYDNNGNMVKTVDPEGFVTKQHFNSRNFLTATERVIGSKKSNITRFEHDNEGNTTRVDKGLNSWQDEDYSSYNYKYNQLNQLVLMLDASNKETHYQYDSNGNLIKLIDRNKVETSYIYDGLNRLVEKRNSKDGRKNAVKITFDKLGQTRQMSDESGTTIFGYDDLGRLNGINYGNGIRQNYTYDKADRVSNLSVLQGSLRQINLNYEYDKAGRLNAVRDNGKKFGYKYNAIGQLTEETNGVTGVKFLYQYYSSGNIKNLRHFSGPKLLSSYEYKYDMRGNQTEKNEGTGTTKYYYDSLSRIKTVLEPDKTQNYEYDDLDNIRELTEIKGNKIETTSYLYNRDSRLLLQETDKGSETVQKRFTYDDNGNQLTKDEVVKRNGSTVASKNWNYWYDGYNQLKRVQNPDGNFVEYKYNGNGLRTRKDFGDKAINYFYNGGNIILETDKDNAVTAKNIRGLRLIYRESYANSTTDPQFLYYLHNAHGDVTQLLNEKAEVIKDYRYDAFGQEQMPEDKVFGGKQSVELWRQEVEKVDNPFRYCGEYLDEETGNYYLRARYYDPGIQRFVNEDSYGVEKGASWLKSLYNYTGNNPVNRIDPSGHDPFGIKYSPKVQRLIADYKQKKTIEQKKGSLNHREAEIKSQTNPAPAKTTVKKPTEVTVKTKTSIPVKQPNQGTSKTACAGQNTNKNNGNIINSNNLNKAGTIFDITKGVAKATKSQNLGGTATFVGTRINVLQVVADISEQVVNNPKQSLDTSITKGKSRCKNWRACGNKLRARGTTWYEHGNTC